MTIPKYTFHPIIISNDYEKVEILWKNPWKILFSAILRPMRGHSKISLFRQNYKNFFRPFQNRISTTLACNCSLGSFQPVKYFTHRPTWRTFSKTSEFRIIPITINRTKYRRYGWGYWVTEYFTDQRTDLACPHPRRPPTYAFHPSITSGNSILGWKERQPTYHNKIVGQAPNAIRAEFNVVKGSQIVEDEVRAPGLKNERKNS